MAQERCESGGLVCLDGLLVMAPRNADREKCVKALNKIAVGEDVDRKREQENGPGTKIGLKF